MLKKSKKQIKLEKTLLGSLNKLSLKAAEYIFNDKEIQYTQDFANIVSIKRLGFNDHGPVHMRKSAINAIKMFDLMLSSGIKFNLEKEGIGTSEDSKVAVLVASLLHDLGMSTARGSHEFTGIMLGLPIIERILKHVYDNDLYKITVLKSLIVEGILGHMATQKIHSLEAGLVLIGDGCDMQKGRARIPALISQKPRVGDIHKYSASSIENVEISKGSKKPIKIEVYMSQTVGFFQIEEVLFPKILSSPVKPFIELYAGVLNEDMMKYL